MLYRYWSCIKLSPIFSSSHMRRLRLLLFSHEVQLPSVKGGAANLDVSCQSCK